MKRQENRLWRESDDGNVGKYQEVKDGKTAVKSREYSVLYTVTSRYVDMLCRRLSLKNHLCLNLKTLRMKSRQSEMCIQPGVW